MLNSVRMEFFKGHLCNSTKTNKNNHYSTKQIIHKCLTAEPYASVCVWSNNATRIITDNDFSELYALFIEVE